MATELLTESFYQFKPSKSKVDEGFLNASYNENLESPKEISKRLGYLYPEYQRKVKLSNGLEIKNRKQFITKTYKKDYVLAYDTETYEGTCRLLARNTEVNNYVLNPTFIECLRFLMYKANKTNGYRFFYNIDFDVSAILKLWDSKGSKVREKWILRKIEWLKNGIEIKYGKYSLKWLKGRMFIVKDLVRKKSVVFTDLFNFFHLGLNKVAKKYLNQTKISNINGNKLNTSLAYWNKRKKDIIEYCVQDCFLTAKLGNYLIESIERSELPLPRCLVSSASLSKQYFRLNCHISCNRVIPKRIVQIAYDTYYGGRFEMFKRGYFKRLFLYDINSQYPSFIRDLPSMREGVWKSTKYVPKKPCLAYFKVKVKIPRDYKIPTIPIYHKGVNKFPVGTITKWMTWFDLDLIRDYIVKVYEGYIFKKAPKSYKPFKKAIDNLFAKKQEFKGKCELEYNLTKLCMNALYGCFIETHKIQDIMGNNNLNAGIMFNSVYASQITAFGRWSVIKDVPRDKYDNIIAIHTDSLISNIPLDDYLTLDLELGNWSKECEGKGIVLNTGMYQIGYLVKTRGVPKRYIKNWLRFCLKNQIYLKKSFIIEHMRKLSEGLIRDKSLINVNTMMIDKRTVNCNSDTKRDWFSDFNSFQEVLTKFIDSYPYYCYDDESDLHPNPLCVGIRYDLSQIV